MKKNYRDNPYLGVHTPRTQAEAERGADYGGVIYSYERDRPVGWVFYLFVLGTLAGLAYWLLEAV